MLNECDVNSKATKDDINNLEHIYDKFVKGENLCW